MSPTRFAIVLITLPALGLGQSRAELEEQLHLEALFAEQMSGCKMTGRFTVDGDDGAPQTDSYTLGEVKKVRDEKWRIEAKIEYGDKSATLPLTVEVFWAAETPMIQVTDLAVPTLGTFSARVLIHGDQYAGTWSGKDHGGQMYGHSARAASTPQDGDGNWPSWRGAAGTGEAPGGTPPTEWSEDKNVVWKTPLPGLGNSTPVVWGDRIYLTTAVETDESGGRVTGLSLQDGGRVAARAVLNAAGPASSSLGPADAAGAAAAAARTTARPKTSTTSA